MKNIEKESDFTIEPKKRFLPHESPSNLPEYVIDSDSNFTLYVTDQVLSGVREFTRQDSRRELGGVLFGQHFSQYGRMVVKISNFLPLPSQSTSPTHFDFDEYALQALWSNPRSNSNEYLVGWFHSHPHLGDPFMSTLDLDLHRQYFKDLWYVSCVVATGEFALPVCFWRIQDNSLIAIPDFFVHMTETPRPGEQSRRFMRASNQEEVPLNYLVSSSQTIFEDLGIDRTLLSDLGITKESKLFEGQDHSYSPASALVMLLDTAIYASRDASNIAKIEEIKVALCQTRFIEKQGHLVFNSPKLKENIAVHGSVCCCLSQGSSKDLILADFISNIYRPVSLILLGNKQSPPVLRDCKYSNDGTLWIAVNSSGVVRMPRELLISSNINPVELWVYNCDIQTESGTISDISPTNNGFWLRADNYFAYFVMDSEKPFLHKFNRDFRLPSKNCHLVSWRNMAVEDSNDAVVVVGVLERNICLWNSHGELVQSVRLPDAMRDLNILDAALASTGIYILFDCKPFGKLVLFDSSDLSIKAYYLHNLRIEDRCPITSISSDDLGRLYIKRGDSILLFSETGGLSPDWFHYPSREARGYLF